MFYQILSITFIILFSFFTFFYIFIQRKIIKQLKDINNNLIDLSDLCESFVYPDDEDDEEIVENDTFDEDDEVEENNIESEAEYIENLKKELREIPENSKAYAELKNQIQRYENMLNMGISFLSKE